MSQQYHKTELPPQPSHSNSNKKLIQQPNNGFKDNRQETLAQLKLIKAAEAYSSKKSFPIQLKAASGGLPAALKSGVEQLSGVAMDDVNVHYNSNKPKLLQAHAYAQGTDIHLASGQEKHLPHEAWHVVQQKQGRVKPTKQLKANLNINDSAHLEKEADIMGQKANSIAVKDAPLTSTNALQKKELTQQPIQRVIDPVPDLLPKDILQFISDYNKLDEKTPLNERIKKLFIIEHLVYDCLTEFLVPDLNEESTAAPLQEVLNSLKEERVNVVGQSVKNEDHLKEGDLPIAHFDKLNEETQKKIRNIWLRLVTSSGSIKILETDSDTKEEHKGFGVRILTEFSRLLEGEFGRELVEEVNASKHLIFIEPYNEEDEKNKKKDLLVEPIDEKDSDKLTLLINKPEQKLLEFYPETDLTDYTEKERRQFINKLKRKNKNQLGVTLIDSNQAYYYQFGKGSKSRITFPIHAKDASQAPSSRLIDEDNNELVTPLFILLGHELGHAKHIQEGTSSNETDIPNHFQSGKEKKHYGYNQEEYVNIEENENALRQEHQLGQRKGHGNVLYIQKQELTNQLYNIRYLFKLLPNFSKFSWYEEISEWINELMDSTQNTNSSIELKKLKNQILILPSKIQNIQLEFLTNNFDEHIDAEYITIFKAFHGAKFTYGVGIVPTQIMNSIKRELNYEKHQAKEAVKTNTLSEFLKSLTHQRKEYVKTFILIKLELLGNEKQQPSDVKVQNRLARYIQDFETVNWLFKL